MITNTNQGQKSLALLLDEIEKDAKEDESLCPYALTTVPLLVKALRRAMQALEEKEAVSDSVDSPRQNKRDSQRLDDFDNLLKIGAGWMFTPEFFNKKQTVRERIDELVVEIAARGPLLKANPYAYEANLPNPFHGRSVSVGAESDSGSGSSKVLSEITAILEGKEQEKDSGDKGSTP